MTTVAWWHCFSGIAGDMAMSSLIDAGADLHEVRSVLAALPFRGWDLEAEPVLPPVDPAATPWVSPAAGWPVVSPATG